MRQNDRDFAGFTSRRYARKHDREDTERTMIATASQARAFSVLFSLSREPSDTAHTDPPPWRAGAFVDTGYAFNNNRPGNHVYRGHVPTPRTNEFTVNLAGVYVRRESTPLLPWTFELGLHVGPAANALVAAEPGAGSDFAGSNVWRHLAVANTSVDIRRSRTSIAGGLFVSPIGIGGAWTKDNWNTTVSWESNAAPFYLLGARLTQDIGSVLQVQAWLINGWQTMSDANHVPSGLLGLVVTPAPGLQWAHYLYFGPDSAATAVERWRIHADTQVVYDRPRFGVGAVWDVGGDGASRTPAFWTGGAIFSRARLAAAGPLQWELALRPECWWDRDGAMFGVRQWLVSGTATTSLRLYDAMLVRLEYRYDRSTAPSGFFFRGDAITTTDALAAQQHSVFVNLVGYYEFSFGRP